MVLFLISGAMKCKQTFEIGNLCEKDSLASAKKQIKSHFVYLSASNEF